jgi:hypothetical protein
MYKISSNEMVPVGSCRFAVLSDDYVSMSQDNIKKYLGIQEFESEEKKKPNSADKRAAKRLKLNLKKH